MDATGQRERILSLVKMKRRNCVEESRLKRILRWVRVHVAQQGNRRIISNTSLLDRAQDEFEDVNSECACVFNSWHGG